MSITLAISLVVLPIAFERFPGLRARWAMARAANAVDLGDGDSKQLLRDAAKQFSDPKQERDYWHVRLKIALKSNDDSIIKVLYEAASVNIEFRSLVDIAFRELEKKGDFHNALEALILYNYRTTSAPIDIPSLNQISYLRALAKADLETALQDMDQVLKKAPDIWEFRDTRAWILYELGRFSEALDDANMAVKQSSDALEAAQTGIWNQILGWANSSPQPLAKDGLLTREEAGVLWSVGVVRYHRGKVLEALGKRDEAELDWQWLAERKLPSDDRMH